MRGRRAAAALSMAALPCAIRGPVVTLQRRFGVDFAALRPLYEKDGKLTDAALLRRVQTDFIFTLAAMGMAGLAAREAPAWSYYFAYVPQAERATMPGAALRRHALSVRPPACRQCAIAGCCSQVAGILV